MADKIIGKKIASMSRDGKRAQLVITIERVNIKMREKKIFSATRHVKLVATHPEGREFHYGTPDKRDFERYLLPLS